MAMNRFRESYVEKIGGEYSVFRVRTTCCKAILKIANSMRSFLLPGKRKVRRKGE